MENNQINKNCWILIAAYNEEKVIKGVVEGLRPFFSNVIVVDDCSTDNTRAEAIAGGAFCVRHPINLGQGAALQTGIDFALRRGGQIFITFDADGQHQVKDAVMLSEKIKFDEADIICGSRFKGIQAKNIPRRRKFFLRLAVLFTRITSGVPVTDAHNGLRAFNRKSAQSIKITQNRMAHASEIIGQIRKYELRFKEEPVEIIYSEYSLAKGQRLSNSVNILMDLFIGEISK